MFESLGGLRPLVRVERKKDFGREGTINDGSDFAQGGTIQHLEACGVDLYLDQQALDTTTPTGKLMFQVTGAFAEFERAMIRQRIHAGLKRAVANGKTLGRPLNNPKAVEKARQELGKGLGINKVARQVGLSNSTVARLKSEMRA